MWLVVLLYHTQGLFNTDQDENMIMHGSVDIQGFSSPLAGRTLSFSNFLPDSQI